MYPRLLLAATVYTLVVAAIHYLEGHDVAIGLLYLVPVAVVSGLCSRRAGLIMGLAATGTWATVDALRGHVSATPIHYPMNLVIEFGAAIGIVLLANSLRHGRTARADDIAQRRVRGDHLNERELDDAASQARATMRRIERDGTSRRR